MEVTSTINLYRGDDIPPNVAGATKREKGRTFAGHFCGNGLMARFADGGNSSLLVGDLLDKVLAHVGYEHKTREHEFYLHSPLISFSEDLDAAFFFSNPKLKNLEECPLWEASQFIWEFKLPLNQKISQGRYGLYYKSDSRNCQKIINDQLKKGFSEKTHNGDGDLLATALMNQIAASYVMNYYLEFINVVEYVNSQNLSGRNQRLIDNTLKRAEKHKEWLIFPSGVTGINFSSRVAMNSYLSVYKCYRKMKS